MTDAAPLLNKRERLAHLLHDQEGRGQAPLAPARRGARIPVSYAQMRLWLLDQLEPGSPAYTIASIFRMTGALRFSALEASINEIIRRHEALRTTFLQEDGVPYQVVQPFVPLALEAVDVAGTDGDEAERRVMEMAEEQARRPFDLATGPLLRFKLFRKSELEHVLSLNVHHIISDAWSFKLFTQELATLYADCLREARISLPPLPMQFADYCIWERRRLGRGLLEEQLGYWKKQLAGPLPVIQLPADRPRHAKQSRRGALHRFYIRKTVVERVKTFSQQSGVTPFMTLLAVFQVLVYRYTGQTDVLVGSAFAGRGKREVHELIGFFVNTLPLRVSLAGHPSFAELLQRVRAVALEAYAHQELPFIKLVEELQPERDASYSPLVQIMFVMRQKAPAPRYELPELELSRPILVDVGVAKFDLSLSLEEEEDRVSAEIEYNADLFDASRIERLERHFMTLLEAAIRAPQQRIAEIPILAEGEEAIVLRALPAARQGEAACFHRIFEARVAERPDHPAVVLDGDQLTYRELDTRANELARRLRRIGVGPEVLVGVCLERSIAWITSILAVLKAGGGYVPIDPSLPEERISFLLEDAKISVAIVDNKTDDHLRQMAVGVEVVNVEVFAAEDGAEPEPGTTEKASQVAYVIYTSGSTGKPKGVLVEHSGLQNLVEAQVATFGVTRDSRTLQFASSSFDASIFEIAMALGTGATLVLAPAFTVGARLLELLQKEGITHVTLPPSVLASLPHAELPALQTIITAGEPCPLQLVDRWGAAHSFFNAYGPTEATVWSTVARCEPGQRISIGTPISGTRVYILDDRQQPVPIGIPGEMYIGGVGLARGYLGRPTLTAGSFIQDPFGAIGTRVYRTGDCARFREDGNIEFLGRTDEQVKIRGFRIELEEVEACLLQHPRIREAAVIVKGEDLNEKRLVAYYVGEGPAPSAAEARALLKRKLPAHMVPSQFVELPSLPLTSSNKVDRRALRQLETLPEEAVELTAPSTATEEIIANIWAEVLQLERVGVHDDFFELGGHSLHATQVVARICDAIGQSLPVSVLFERPTVAGLAHFLAEAAAQERVAMPMARVAPGESYRLSFAQQRLWFLDSIMPGRPDYNIPIVVHLRGPLDEPAFCSALRALVHRHEILRTRYTSIDGVPRQIVCGDSFDIPIVALDDRSPRAQEAETERLAAAEAGRPFDFAHEASIRARILRCSAQHRVLLLTLHHIAADDGSMAILFRDLNALYGAIKRGLSPDLPALPMQYKDFAEWQRRCVAGVVLEAQLAYWRQQLSNLPEAMDIPTAHSPPAARTNAGDSVGRSFPPALVAALKRLSRQESCTLFMTMLGGFQTLLHRYTGHDDVFLGTPVTNRNRSETENVIGFFGNAVVMRTDVSGEPTFRQLLGRVRKTALGAYQHADIPFEELVDKLGLGRGRNNPQPLQVMFAFRDAGSRPKRLADVAVTVAETDNKTSKFDLTILVGVDDDCASVRLQYSTDLFDRPMADRMLEHFQVVLENMARDPDQRIGAFSLLTEEERRRREFWNATATDYPQLTPVHGLFEAHARATPNETAVVWGERRLTYQELNYEANRLSRRLQLLGVHLEEPVGVYMDRSIEMVVSLLAILRAGGVCVPIDMAYPKERVAFMLADARVKVLMTRDGVATDVAGDAAVCVVELQGGAESTECAEGASPRVDIDDLAYILYTSGSTGKPKGVAIPHRAINRLLRNTNYVRIDATDRVAQANNASFDLAIFEIWGALVNGACLVGVDKEIVLSPDDFRRYTSEKRVSVLLLATALFNLIANSAPATFASFGSVLFAGEAADGKSVKQVLAKGRPVRLINAYGPTESTTFATAYAIDDIAEDAGTVSIGTPISNTYIHVLDRDLHPVPVGIPGEVYIGGAGLARGYLNRPALTAERFIPDPWSREPGARLYKTGDLARYRSDGTIDYLKRLDGQVKIGGNRIELGEIEAALRAHHALTDAAVLVREDVPGQKRLIAYYVHPDCELAASELRQFLGRRLPNYMIPSAFIGLKTLPLTPNGKVDRKKLLEIEVVPQRELEYVAPSSQLEKAISAAWQDVLKLDKVGRYDNFFDVGGSSLLLPQILSRLNAALGRNLALINLFQYPSVHALAQFLSEEVAAEPSFARTSETTSAMRASRSRQARRRKTQ